MILGSMFEDSSGVLNLQSPEFADDEDSLTGVVCLMVIILRIDG
jgi:hypothetical protein